ncbi:MAG TPA: hypothetical protein PKC39_10875 [Ferruginibacter sp.]|nr:hypothetical protein [Ferruginibacter sp.]HMP21452.1 hypothetical protein [Ferruginibacter sp.]
MSSSSINQQGEVAWKYWQLLLFKIVFLFLLLLTIPFNASYYLNLLGFSFHFQDFFQLTYHKPGLVHLSNWGLKSFAGWFVALVVAIAGAVLWQKFDKRTAHQDLYYWSRVVLRYRLALGIIAYGILLLIPVQIPALSISDLHTPYGDFLPWKIYYHSTAVASAGYKQTIGAIEIIGGFLLLYRPSVLFGAITTAFVLVNIVLANFAYQLGDHLYSTYLLLIAFVLLAHDVPRLYKLLVLRKKVIAEQFRPFASVKFLKWRNLSRAAFLLFTLTLFSLTLSSYLADSWPYPNTPGLNGAAGFYNVDTFRYNDSTHQYSLTDTVRWRDVVFEKWNVLSVRKNKLATIDFSLPEVKYRNDAARNYQSAGNGARSFYTYRENDGKIFLTNNNDKADTISFSVSRPDTASIHLGGVDAQGNRLQVVLGRVNKNYLLDKGRRNPVVIN